MHIEREAIPIKKDFNILVATRRLNTKYIKRNNLTLSFVTFLQELDKREDSKVRMNTEEAANN